MEKILLGISSCLLGNPVRFDGGHKLDRFLTETLGAYVTYLPVCPEVEAGFGVPRESMRLTGLADAPRLVTTRTGRDLTDAMAAWARRRVEELAAEELCGFIFKSDSPSSGMERVRVYGPAGMPEKKGVGVFARAFMERFPLLPVEEEGRLHDPVLRENFIEAIFTLKRFRESMASSPRGGELVDFHTRHKLLIMSHAPAVYREMGRLVAGSGKAPREEVRRAYGALLLRALRHKTTVRKHVDVLQHMAGHFKKILPPDERRELQELIEAYRREEVPLIVPVTLLNHQVRKHGVAWLAAQVYLNPHPLELRLRNHA